MSVNTWIASTPIAAARSAARSMPWPRGRWAPRRRPFASIGRKRTGAAAAPTYTGDVDADLLAGLRALVDTNRLRIVARVGARPASLDDLAMELRQPVPSVARQVDVLMAAGLVERTGDRNDTLRARWDRVGELAKALATLEGDATGAGEADGGAWPHDGETLAETLDRMGATPDEARVLRSFLVDGRLETIPAQHRKRQVVLRFLLERVFTEDREYPEKEVNQRLALFNPDVGRAAALPGRRRLRDARSRASTGAPSRVRRRTRPRRRDQPWARPAFVAPFDPDLLPPLPPPRRSGVYSPPITGSISPKSPSRRRYRTLIRSFSAFTNT